MVGALPLINDHRSNLHFPLSTFHFCFSVFLKYFNVTNIMMNGVLRHSFFVEKNAFFGAPKSAAYKNENLLAGNGR